VLHNSITELGTHVFPMVDMFERPDIDGRGSNMFAPVIVPALGQRRPEWWVLAHLARRLDLDILDGTDPDECRPEEIAARANRASAEQLAALEAAGPYGLPFERPFGWVRERALPDGRWRLAPTELVARLPELLSESPARSTFRLTARRRLAMLNSVAYTQEDRIQPGAVVLHPDDAARIGVGEGASIRITTAAGSISGRVLCDVGMKPGTVFLPHGATEHNVNQLVNRTETVDPLTGQPWLSAFSVEIAAP
jgi:assimilatory nitrate reductase catalytic subunit